MIRIITIVAVIVFIVGCKTVQLEDWQIRQAEVLREDRELERAEEKEKANRCFNDYIADGPCCGK